MNGPASGLLVTADELAEHPAWRVFDCRHDLRNTEYGRQAYARGHIPGALFFHLDEDLSGATNGSNGRHPLPAVADFYRRNYDSGVDA
jgi:thiosulfate/3-mercaptopyruvate sulfurtransferase